MTTKLSLYNGALLECGERPLADLSEVGQPRRLLDQAWDADFVDYVLGQGQWKFATRTAELVASTTVQPPFGYAKAYDIPVDLVRTVGLCSDEFMTEPLLAYATEQDYIFSDVEPIYLSYVSNDTDYGGDLSRWPPDFVQYVHACLASRIIKPLNQSESDRKTLYSLVKMRLTDARSSDAMEGPTKFLPTGTFVRARMGRGGSRIDRGRRNRLIG